MIYEIILLVSVACLSPLLLRAWVKLSKKKDLRKLDSLKKEALKEFHETYSSLTATCDECKIVIPLEISDSYKQKIISSWGPLRSRFYAIRDLLVFLNGKIERSELERFAVFSSKGLESCTFSSSFLNWENAKQECKESLWYSYEQVTRQKNSPEGDGALFVEDAPFDKDKEYALAEHFYAIMVANPRDLQRDRKRYEMCFNRIRKNLLFRATHVTRKQLMKMLDPKRWH